MNGRSPAGFNGRLIVVPLILLWLFARAPSPSATVGTGWRGSAARLPSMVAQPSPSFIAGIVLALALTGSATARALQPVPVDWDRAANTVTLKTPSHWLVGNCGIDSEGKASNLQAEVSVAKHPTSTESFVIVGNGTAKGIAQLLRAPECADAMQTWERLQKCVPPEAKDRVLGMNGIRHETNEIWVVCGLQEREGVTRFVLAFSREPPGHPARTDAQEIQQTITFGRS